MIRMRDWTIAVCVLFCTVAANAQMVRFVREMSGPNTERHGSSIATLGDLNGDGIDDFVVAGEEYSVGVPARGIVRVIDGKIGAEIRNHVGTAAGDRLGTTVAAVGDVNQDGIPDYVIAAPRFDPTAALADAGIAYLYSGTGLLLQTYAGTAANMRLGSAVAAVGDQNGDGWIDIAIGAPQAAPSGTNSGLIEIRSGQNGAVLFTIAGTSGQRLGAAIVGADVNGDGFQDIVACATHANAQGSMTGRVTAYAHGTGTSLGFIDGAAAGDQFGLALQNLGDITGDGRDDLAIGAPFSDVAASNAGTVRVVSFLAGQSLATMHGSGVDENFGRRIAAGDIGQNGSIELLIGAPGFTGPEGAAQGRVVLADTLGSTIEQFIGRSAGAEFGYSCAFARGGVAGTGIAIGAWKQQPIFGNGEYGGVYVYDFATPELPLVGRYRPNVTNSKGKSIIGPDLDGDGCADILATDYVAIAIPPSANSGRVEAVSSKSGKLLWRRDGQPGEGLGLNVAPVGDQNGDNVVDLGVADSIGTVHILSGVDGTEIGTTVDSENLGYYGRSILALDDLDGDGIREFAVSRAATVTIGPSGRIDVHHGGDFALLWSVSELPQSFGSLVDLCEDKNGDGRRDIVAAAVVVSMLNPNEYALDIRVLSSVTGAQLAFFTDFGGYTLGAVLDLSLTAIGDVDQDGKIDFSVQSGLVESRILSGLDFTPVYGTDEAGPVSAVGDVDQDGAADFYVVEPYALVPGAPRVRLISGASHTILAEAPMTAVTVGVIPTSHFSDGDCNGDGALDLLLRDTTLPSTQPNLAPHRCISLVGGQQFGKGIDALHAIDLSWSPVAASIVDGFVEVSGAPVFAPGIIGVATRRESSIFAGESVLLPVSPTETLMAFFGFDGLGEASFYVNLRQPALANQTISLQTFAIDPAAAMGLSSSNGLMLRFTL